MQLKLPIAWNSHLGPPSPTSPCFTTLFHRLLHARPVKYQLVANYNKYFFIRRWALLTYIYSRSKNLYTAASAVLSVWHHGRLRISFYQHKLSITWLTFVSWLVVGLSFTPCWNATWVFVTTVNTNKFFSQAEKQPFVSVFRGDTHREDANLSEGSLN